MITIRRFEAEKPEAIENQLLELLKVCFEKELKDISDERLMRTGIRQNGWFVALDEKTNEVFGCAQIIRDQRIANVHSTEIQTQRNSRGINEVYYYRH